VIFADKFGNFFLIPAQADDGFIKMGSQLEDGVTKPLF
jgi:hypothetical protein